jgi:hypothetical protein
MRAAPTIVAMLLALLVGCGARADGPKITAPISPEDVREISAMVRAETSEPLESIAEVETEAFVPGVTPRHSVRIGPNGERQEVTMYPSPDRVWVFTQPPRGAQLWLDIHKKDGKWTIVKKERVTYR